jgi:NADPH:quinone reductase-like Zn-dependent oxidoreductase
MLRVFKSTVIDAPISQVWALLRDFNGHDRWHPAVASCQIEGGKRPDQVGCVRRFRLRSGGELREQLLALSDSTYSFTYCVLDAPLPLNDYVATLALKPITDGDRTLWTWSSEFDAPADRAAELAALLGEQIYEAGFDAVRSILTDEAPPQRARFQVQRAPTGEGAPRASGPVPTAGGALQAGAIVVHEYGGPEVLRWERVSVPPPGPGEVRLRQTAVGLNYIDVYCRSGYFDLVSLPGTPGMEAAGVVLDVGPGVHGLLPGDRVAYACPPVGAYAELRTMEADLMVPLPDEIDDETAAAGLLKGITAEFLLHRVHAVQPDERVLVQAAAGGVGLLLCQWARALGATVIGTVGSADKARLAREHGCSYPILYREQDFVEAVMEITDGRGADVVYDAVGRDTFEKSYAALATRGHLVSFGQASGHIGKIDIGAFAAKSATISRPNYGHYTSTPQELRASTDRLFAAIRQGLLRVEARQRYPLREAATAHRELEARRTVGSSILTV